MATIQQLIEAFRQSRGQAMPVDELASRVASYGPNPTARMLQSDINRNVLPGAKSPGQESLTPSDLAGIDRYAWGQQAGLGGIPTAVYSELVKMPAIQEAMKPVTRAIGKATGFPEAEQWYQTDEGSSPASLQNILAYVEGALGDRKVGKASGATLGSLLALASARPGTASGR